MKKLIVNADDFGFNRQITDAIVECHKLGTITSTTLMTNMPAFDYAVEFAKSLPDLSVGIHLNLTLGKPVSPPEQIPDLVDENCNFQNQDLVFSKSNRFSLPSEQVKKEFKAQIQKFLDSGIFPSHCDTHHHVGATLQTFFLKMKMLKKYKINRIRTHRSFFHSNNQSQNRFPLFVKAAKLNFKTLPIRCAYEFEHLYAKLQDYKLPDARFSLPRIICSKPLDYNIEGWKTFIANLPKGIIETTVHPSKPSEDPMDRKEYREHRVIEYELLSNPETVEIFKQQNIELINFNQLD